jgi:hypothetical protein
MGGAPVPAAHEQAPSGPPQASAVGQPSGDGFAGIIGDLVDGRFAFEGGGASKFLQKALTGEGVPLMRCQGQGDVFLAELAHDVHLLNLTNSGLSISGKNVLAFSLSLTGTSSG